MVLLMKTMITISPKYPITSILLLDTHQTSTFYYWRWNVSICIVVKINYLHGSLLGLASSICCVFHLKTSVIYNYTPQLSLIYILCILCKNSRLFFLIGKEDWLIGRKKNNKNGNIKIDVRENTHRK